MVSKEKRLIKRMKSGEPRAHTITPIASDMVFPNHSGTKRDPIYDGELATKGYVDSVSSGAPEGTAVKSTGEAGGTKFLREDGDGTSSWQTVPGSGAPEGSDVLSTGPVTSGIPLCSNGTGGANWYHLRHQDLASIPAADHYDWTTDVTNETIDVDNIPSSCGGDAQTDDPLSQFAATTSAQLAGVISDETGTGSLVFASSPTLVTPALGTPASGTLTNCTFPDNWIKNDADDTSTHKITAANFAVTGDNNTNDSEYVPMVLHGTDATPPAASTVPRGTIYIQYTA